MLQESKIVVAKGVRIVGSVMHFTFQTAADLVLVAEVKTLERLDVYDLTIKELKQARTERTKLVQYKLKQTPIKALKGIRELKKIINKKSIKVRPINT